MNEQLDRIELKLAELEGKVDMVYRSSETMRTYLLWGFWITVGAIALPLLLLPALAPLFFSSLAIPAGF